MAPGVNIRPPAFAGSFYPRNKTETVGLLKQFFSKTKAFKNINNPKALIVPHAGWIYSGQVAAWGFCQLPQISDQHFVLIGPSHFYTFTGLAASASDFWETPLGKVKHLPPKHLNSQVFLDDQPHAREHCLEVQLPFLQYRLKNFSISCFLTGIEIDIAKAAQYLLSRYPHSIFVISSDLSHYLPEQAAHVKDQKTIEAILAGNQKYIEHEENVACGGAGIQILINMAKTKDWQGHSIFYDTSATASSNSFEVVGYASIGYFQ